MPVSFIALIFAAIFFDSGSCEQENNYQWKRTPEDGSTDAKNDCCAKDTEHALARMIELLREERGSLNLELFELRGTCSAQNRSIADLQEAASINGRKTHEIKTQLKAERRAKKHLKQKLSESGDRERDLAEKIRMFKRESERTRGESNCRGCKRKAVQTERQSPRHVRFAQVPDAEGDGCSRDEAAAVGEDVGKRDCSVSTEHVDGPAVKIQKRVKKEVPAQHEYSANPVSTQKTCSDAPETASGTRLANESRGKRTKGILNRIFPRKGNDTYSACTCGKSTFNTSKVLKCARRQSRDTPIELLLTMLKRRVDVYQPTKTPLPDSEKAKGSLLLAQTVAKKVFNKKSSQSMDLKDDTYKGKGDVLKPSKNSSRPDKIFDVESVQSLPDLQPRLSPQINQAAEKTPSELHATIFNFQVIPPAHHIENLFMMDSEELKYDNDEGMNELLKQITVALSKFSITDPVQDEEIHNRKFITEGVTHPDTTCADIPLLDVAAMRPNVQQPGIRSKQVATVTMMSKKDTKPKNAADVYGDVSFSHGDTDSVPEKSKDSNDFFATKDDSESSHHDIEPLFEDPAHVTFPDISSIGPKPNVGKPINQSKSIKSNRKASHKAQVNPKRTQGSSQEAFGPENSGTKDDRAVEENSTKRRRRAQRDP